MIKLLISLIAVLISSASIASTLLTPNNINYPKAQESVYKVYKMDEDDRPRMVATAFALNYMGNTYIVTNNHVCEGLAGPGDSYIKIRNGSTEDLANDYDLITDVSITRNSDVCIMKTANPHPGLNMSKSPASLYQTVTVFGYLGRSDFSMISPGKLYGSEAVEDFAGFISCKERPPAIKSVEAIICAMYGYYPLLSRSTVYTATVNIGPGFSGSPVLDNNGDVVGIVSRYMPPSKIYGNGDGIFYSTEYIINAIQTATFIPVDDEQLEKNVKVWDIYMNMKEALFTITAFFTGLFR